MNRRILVLLALCAFAAAMIPRDRRAVDPELEEQQNAQKSSSTTTKAPRQICAPRTPCAWSVYKPTNKIIDFNMSNTYCECGPGLTCLVTEDDSTVSAYVYRCRSPSEHDDSIVDS